MFRDGVCMVFGIFLKILEYESTRFYFVCFYSHQMFDHHSVRVTVSSPILPARVLEYNMDTKSMVC